MGSVVIKPPNQIKIKNKCVYEVVHIDGFLDDAETMGECRYDIQQIVLKKGLTKTQEVKTLIHEIIHALCFERKIEISHKAIYQLEDAIYYIITRNKF